MGYRLRTESGGEGVEEDEMFELIVLDHARRVLVQLPEEGLHELGTDGQLQLLQHEVQFERRDITVFVVVELVEKLTEKKFVICSLALLDQLEP